MESENMNLGNLDRAIRGVLGFGIFFWGLHVDSMWGFAGFLLIFSGLFGFDPFYKMAHINSRTTREKMHHHPRTTGSA